MKTIAPTGRARSKIATRVYSGDGNRLRGCESARESSLAEAVRHRIEALGRSRVAIRLPTGGTVVFFVLPYHTILEKIGIDPATVKDRETVPVPKALLELLLRMLIAQAGFDEADYLARNPDVRAAVRDRQVRSGHEHFLTVGYLEGRHGGCPVVDERYYVEAYADVARDVARGKIAAGADHYFTSGLREWRVPAAEAANAVAAWRSVLTQPRAQPAEVVAKPPAKVNGTKVNGTKVNGAKLNGRANGTARAAARPVA